MYHAGLLIIHHKINTRKYYDLAIRHISEDIYFSPDPFETDEEYYDFVSAVWAYYGIVQAMPGSVLATSNASSGMRLSLDY